MIGRASGRDFDARRDHVYAPYDELRFDAPIRRDGDVNARVWVRIREVEESLRLIDADPRPAARTGQFSPTPRPTAGPARAGRWSKAFAATCSLTSASATTARSPRCHLRDPSWFQWPLLEAAIEGNIVADFPLCNKSFNCSYSGHDL